MIFDKELDYLEPLGLRRVQLASNSISVQMNLLRQGAGLGIVHDFALPLPRNCAEFYGSTEPDTQFLFNPLRR